MANGLPITDPASGYDPQKPYENREKRFYQSIVYDGSTWLGDVMIMKQGVGSLNATDLNNSSISTRTGYYIRKGINPKYATASNNLNSANWIIFRYAEVLLSYAEARNEATGPDQSVYDAINAIRRRSELPDLTPGMDQSQLRTAIRRERRVEWVYTVVPAGGGNRAFFPNKNYFLPIPQSAMDKNTKLVQNPNYL
jgi:hypothetical protein